jgi:hypothetical protein
MSAPDTSTEAFANTRGSVEDLPDYTLLFARCPGAPYCGHLARLVAFGRGIRRRPSPEHPE